MEVRSIDTGHITDYIVFLNKVRDCVYECRDKTGGNNKSAVPDAIVNIVAHIIGKFCEKDHDNLITISIEDLAIIAGCETRKVCDKMAYFKTYNIGNFISIGKKDIEINIVENTNKFRKETYPKYAYTIYFSKEFIEILDEFKILQEKLNYQKLIKDIAVSEQIINALSNKDNIIIQVKQEIPTLKTPTNSRDDILTPRNNIQRQLLNREQGKGQERKRRNLLRRDINESE